MRINCFRFNYLSTVLWYVLKSRSHAKSLSPGYLHVHLISILICKGIFINWWSLYFYVGMHGLLKCILYLYSGTNRSCIRLIDGLYNFCVLFSIWSKVFWYLNTCIVYSLYAFYRSAIIQKYYMSINICKINKWN